MTHRQCAAHMPAVSGSAGSDGSSRAICWRLDLLLGGLGAMLVGGTVVICLIRGCSPTRSCCCPRALVVEAATVDEEDSACDVTAVDCANNDCQDQSLSLSAVWRVLPRSRSYRFHPPLSWTADATSAAAALRHAYSWVGPTARCVAWWRARCSRGADRGGPPVGTDALVKFVLACAVTCTPCRVAVGLALALAHPEAHEFAVMVEEDAGRACCHVATLMPARWGLHRVANLHGKLMRLRVSRVSR